MWSVFVYSPFLLQYIREDFVPLIGKVSLFLHTFPTKLRARIGTLLNLNIFKSNNNAFVEKLF